MRQNDWTDLLRRRLADREAPVPDDLWDRIEQRLDARPHRHAGVTRLVAWLASAAAVALVIGVAYDAGEQAGRPGAVRFAGRNAALDRVPSSILAHVETGLSPTDGGFVASAAPMVSHGESRSVERGLSVACAGDSAVDSGCGLAARHDSAQRPAAGSNGARHKAHNSEYAYPDAAEGCIANPCGHERVSRWSVGAHTDGSFAGNSQSAFPVLQAMKKYSETGVGNDAVGDYMNNGNAMMLAKYKEVKHHSQPLSVGVSLGYAVTDRLSVTTGLVYTRAVSDFTGSSGGDEVTETQRLHYIGVPLGVKYRIWGIGSVQAYASAACQADFNVKAEMKAGDITTDAERDRVQFSWSAAAGVQLNVAPGVGLYAEPGVRYYFNNGSQVVTIFKDRPWNFNLQLGLRVEF